MPQKKNIFSGLKVIHLSLFVSLVIFTVVASVLREREFIFLADGSLEMTLQIVAVVVSMGALLTGFNLFKRRMLAARSSAEPAAERMRQYLSACLIWWAMIEGPGLLAVIFFLLTGNYGFFALAVFHILVLLLFFPRASNIIVLLNLSSKDVAELEGQNL